MSVGVQFRAMAARLIRHFGEGQTVTLRRRHSLIDPVAGKPPTSLLLNGVHALGATTISLRTAGKLAGRVAPGIRLTIAGTAYEVTVESAAAASNVVAVTIAAPGLLAGAADGVAVTVEAYRDYTFKAFYSSRTEQLADGTLIRSGEQDIVVAADAAPTTPRNDDAIVVNGLPGEAVQVEPVQPGGVAIAWRLRRAGRAA